MENELQRIDRILSEYLDAKESEFEMQWVFELATKAVRFKELLNNIINHTGVGTTTKELIKQLLFFGFNKDELCNEFQFSEVDVDDALAEYEGKEDEE